MGQSSSAPIRSQATDAASQPPPYPREQAANARAAVEELDGDRLADTRLEDDAPSINGGVQGVRRRRSTAGGPREFKRQRPHSHEGDSASSSISSVSSSHGSFETARSGASVPSVDAVPASEPRAYVSASNESVSGRSTHSIRSSRSGGNTLRRLTNHVRSVFSNRSSESSTASASEEAPSSHSGLVNTAVPGTPGILEELQAPAYEPRLPTRLTEDEPSQPHLPLPIPSMPAPAYSRLSGESSAREPTPDDDDSASDSGHNNVADEARTQSQRGRRPVQITRDETTQVEMLSRVLLAAASLTALRLVGSHFGRGELYGGSNEAAAMRRRAQAEIETRRRQRAQGDRDTGDAAGELGAERATNADAAHARDERRPSQASASLPQEFTFAAFLEQLRTGRHSAELSNAMFGSPESNFFRLFRFQEDVEGRIPILLMGIRAAERDAQAIDGEHADDATEPRRRGSHDDDSHINERNSVALNDDDLEVSSHTESSHLSERGDAGPIDANLDISSGEAHSQDGGHDYTSPSENELDMGPDLNYGFSELEAEFQNVPAMFRHLVDREHEDSLYHDGDEDAYDQPVEADDLDPVDDLDPIFDDESEDDDDDENPFRPDFQQPDEGARLLNSLISGLAGIDPTQPHQHEEDAWFRPRRRRPSLSRADSEHNERTAPRHQQAWVIYVLGGSYPRTHPIFFAPSLMTDNPTYEDLLIVEELLGPAKPPVATRSDLESAGGTFSINKTSELLDDRCPVCLMDYQEHDMCRTLHCKHTFHQECVDSWLMRSHNTCPMCRTKAVHTRDAHRPERPGFAAA